MHYIKYYISINVSNVFGLSCHVVGMCLPNTGRVGIVLALRLHSRAPVMAQASVCQFFFWHSTKY